MQQYFNPRSPHGERLSKCLHRASSVSFQSTLPAWGATSHRLFRLTFRNISIHAPRMGSDNWRRECAAENRNFNPRSRMGSDVGLSEEEKARRISIHAPAWGATWVNCSGPGLLKNFNPRSRMGSDNWPANSPVTIAISIHAPAWGAT